jgi:hypothetical protein
VRPLQIQQAAILATTKLLRGPSVQYNDFQPTLILFNAYTKHPATMITTWYTSNLPNDQTDLNKLVQWFHEHDPDWMADALWLRYLRIGRQIYQLKHSDLEWEIREAQFDQLLSTKKRKVESRPPFAFEILPEIPPRDGIDRLSALPHDIRVEVLSHLRLPDVRIDIYGNSVVAGHALSSLALVSKGWRDQVEAFCDHSLLVWKHEAEARLESGESSKWVGWRKLATYTANARMEYVFRTRKYCGVCLQPPRQLWVSMKWPGFLCCDECNSDVCRESFCSGSDEQGSD